MSGSWLSVHWSDCHWLCAFYSDLSLTLQQGGDKSKEYMKGGKRQHPGTSQAFLCNAYGIVPLAETGPTMEWVGSTKSLGWPESGILDLVI